MNKKLFVLTVTALIIALGMSQSVMAKEKKVKYLGHNYKGEVNDQKVPAGKGAMNVNGLMIEGDFSDHSVTNAEVWRTTSMGTSNTSFSGTIAYDESENIVLKAGGVISTKYYYSDPNYYSGYLKNAAPGYVKDTLKEDRLINSGSFEPKELTIPFNVRQDVGFLLEMKDFNMPTLCGSYTVNLTHIDYYKEKVDMDVFATIEHYRDNKLIKTIKIENYKDSEGRIWDYTAEPIDGYALLERIRVKYPNGSYFSCTRDGSRLKISISFEIHYPNGKIVKTSWSNNNTDPVYNMGNFSIQIDSYDRKIIETFAKNVNKEKFTAPHCYEIAITSDSLDFSKLSNSEMEKFIREDVIPYIEDGNSSNYKTSNGTYSKGVFTSNEQKAAADAKRAAAWEAEERAAYNKECRLYGKKYVDAANNGRIIVGMPEKLMLKTKDCRLKATSGNTKMYHIIGVVGYSNSRSTTIGEGVVQTVYVSNGKVTSIVNH